MVRHSHVLSCKSVEFLLECLDTVCHNYRTQWTAQVSVFAADWLFMVALCNRADHIYFHAVVCSFFFLLSSFFLSSPNLSRRRLDVCHTSTHGCGLSANLRCRSETCCTRLAENTGREKVSKNRHLGTIAQVCRAISSQLRHVSTIGKKFVKQQYDLHMS